MFTPLVIIATILAASLFSAVVLNPGQPLPFPDGTIVRAADDGRVYYIDDGRRRWVDSSETFRAQGFSWNAIRVVSREDLDRHPDGVAISATTQLHFPGEKVILPDLIPFPAQDLQYDVRNGRTVLRFTATFWNQGGGQLDLRADPSAPSLKTDAFRDVFQRIRHTDGSERFKVVGYFLWHAAHRHYHLGDVMDYVLEAAEGDLAKQEGVGSKLVTKEKVSFCVRDTRAVTFALPGAPRGRIFSDCGRGQQGVSVGWADVYRYSLPDQYLDVHDLPPGIYELRLLTNPKHELVEQRIDNNESRVLFRMDQNLRTLDVLLSAAPFRGGSSFLDGRLFRAEGDTHIFVTYRNKKRILPSTVFLNRYSGAVDRPLVLSKSIVDVLPVQNLVQAQNSATVYALNDAGFKRPFRNAEVFASYGFRPEDIASISQDELAAYPDALYVRHVGDGAIFAIQEGNRSSASVSTAVSDEAIHVVNDVDFASYPADETMTF